MAEDLPVVKIVDSIIAHAILQGASDIHIEQGEKDLIISSNKIGDEGAKGLGDGLQKLTKLQDLYLDLK